MTHLLLSMSNTEQEDALTGIKDYYFMTYQIYMESLLLQGEKKSMLIR